MEEEAKIIIQTCASIRTLVCWLKTNNGDRIHFPCRRRCFPTNELQIEKVVINLDSDLFVRNQQAIVIHDW